MVPESFRNSSGVIPESIRTTLAVHMRSSEPLFFLPIAFGCGVVIPPPSVVQQLFAFLARRQF